MSLPWSVEDGDGPPSEWPSFDEMVWAEFGPDDATVPRGGLAASGSLDAAGTGGAGAVAAGAATGAQGSGAPGVGSAANGSVASALWGGMQMGGGEATALERRKMGVGGMGMGLEDGDEGGVPMGALLHDVGSREADGGLFPEVDAVLGPKTSGDSGKLGVRKGEDGNPLGGSRSGVSAEGMSSGMGRQHQSMTDAVVMESCHFSLQDVDPAGGPMTLFEGSGDDDDGEGAQAEDDEPGTAGEGSTSASKRLGKAQVQGQEGKAALQQLRVGSGSFNPETQQWLASTPSPLRESLSSGTAVAGAQFSQGSDSLQPNGISAAAAAGQADADGAQTGKSVPAGKSKAQKDRQGQAGKASEAKGQQQGQRAHPSLQQQELEQRRLLLLQQQQQQQALLLRRRLASTEGGPMDVAGPSLPDGLGSLGAAFPQMAGPMSMHPYGLSPILEGGSMGGIVGPAAMMGLTGATGSLAGYAGLPTYMPRNMSTASLSAVSEAGDMSSDGLTLRSLPEQSVSEVMGGTSMSLPSPSVSTLRSLNLSAAQEQQGRRKVASRRKSEVNPRTPTTRKQSGSSAPAPPSDAAFSPTSPGSVSQSPTLMQDGTSASALVTTATAASSGGRTVLLPHPPPPSSPFSPSPQHSLLLQQYHGTGLAPAQSALGLAATGGYGRSLAVGVTSAGPSAMGSLMSGVSGLGPATSVDMLQQQQLLLLQEQQQQMLLLQQRQLAQQEQLKHLQQQQQLRQLALQKQLQQEAALRGSLAGPGGAAAMGMRGVAPLPPSSSTLGQRLSPLPGQGGLDPALLMPPPPTPVSLSAGQAGLAALSGGARQVLSDPVHPMSAAAVGRVGRIGSEGVDPSELGVLARRGPLDGAAGLRGGAQSQASLLVSQSPATAAAAATAARRKLQEQQQLQALQQQRQQQQPQQGVEQGEDVCTMTPEEKIEKLRRRQQMKLALMQRQQQQLLLQQQHALTSLPGGISAGPSGKQLKKEEQGLEDGDGAKRTVETAGGLGLANHKGSEAEQQALREGRAMSISGSGNALGPMGLPMEGLSEAGKLRTEMSWDESELEGSGESVDAVVLSELEGAMAKLDPNTRVCIRDALYRLSRSALQRMAAAGQTRQQQGLQGQGSASTPKEIKAEEGAAGAEPGSTAPLGPAAAAAGVKQPDSSDQSLSGSKGESKLPSIFESQTNVIDRNIATLLFNRPARPQLFSPDPRAGQVASPLPSAAGTPAASSVLPSVPSYQQLPPAVFPTASRSFTPPPLPQTPFAGGTVLVPSGLPARWMWHPSGLPPVSCVPWSMGPTRAAIDPLTAGGPGVGTLVGGGAELAPSLVARGAAGYGAGALPPGVMGHGSAASLSARVGPALGGDYMASSIMDADAALFQSGAVLPGGSARTGAALQAQRQGPVQKRVVTKKGKAGGQGGAAGGASGAPKRAPSQDGVEPAQAQGGADGESNAGADAGAQAKEETDAAKESTENAAEPESTALARTDSGPTKVLRGSSGLVSLPQGKTLLAGSPAKGAVAGDGERGSGDAAEEQMLDRGKTDSVADTATGFEQAAMEGIEAEFNDGGMLEAGLEMGAMEEPGELGPTDSVLGQQQMEELDGLGECERYLLDSADLPGSD